MPSPFHAGERAIQDGRPWASMRMGRPGFVSSPDATTLAVDAPLIPGDALGQPAVGDAIGLLGIELPTRRRNRANGRVRAVSDGSFTLDVTQSFGNCPKYIVRRGFVPTLRSGPAPERMAALDDEALRFLFRADTFFVATLAEGGADVSHRGGEPGFVEVQDHHTLRIPDYPGNGMFMTLGNLIRAPRTGLLFPDFATGDLLQLTGRTELQWETAADPTRAWTLHVEEVVRLRARLSVR